MLSARAAGAEPIVITDLFQNRLDFAKKLVPGVRTVLIERGSIPKESAEKIKAAAEGPIKLSLECSGVESSIHTAIYVSRDNHRQSKISQGKTIAVHTIWRQGLHHWSWQERTSGNALLDQHVRIIYINCHSSHSCISVRTKSMSAFNIVMQTK